MAALSGLASALESHRGRDRLVRLGPSAAEAPGRAQPQTREAEAAGGIPEAPGSPRGSASRAATSGRPRRQQPFGAEPADLAPGWADRTGPPSRGRVGRPWTPGACAARRGSASTGSAAGGLGCPGRSGASVWMRAASAASLVRTVTPPTAPSLSGGLSGLWGAALRGAAGTSGGQTGEAGGIRMGGGEADPALRAPQPSGLLLPEELVQITLCPRAGAVPPPSPAGFGFGSGSAGGCRHVSAWWVASGGGRPGGGMWVPFSCPSRLSRGPWLLEPAQCLLDNMPVFPFVLHVSF